METNISHMLDIDSRARYDNLVKEILSDKQILAMILKYTLEEFQDWELPEIIPCIGQPDISRVRVEPGHSNPSKVERTADEDSVPGEGKIVYDIRFNLFCQDKTEEKPGMKILINIEAQNVTDSSKLGYHLDNRIIFYLCRMVSSQKEVEFTGKRYDDLKPVRSIWICMDAKNDQDAIKEISLKDKNVYGKGMPTPNVDKLKAVIVQIRRKASDQKSKNCLIAMLEELLGNGPLNERKKVLEKQYGIVMDEKTEGKVQDMSNLGEALWNMALEEGREEGREESRRETVHNLFGMGLNVEQIAKGCNVSVDYVKEVLLQPDLR